MTTQEAYEQIRNWFSREGAVFGVKRSGNKEMGGSMCVYRLDGDVKSPVRCAAGCLIPDELYSPDFENVVIDSLLTTAEPLRNFFKNVNVRFLTHAQSLHDRYASDGSISVSTFLIDLDQLAKQHNLQVPA